jgi:hypothetical protein
MARLLATELKTALASLGYTDIKTLGHNAYGIVVPKTRVAAVVPTLMSAFAEYKPKQISDMEIRIGLLSIHAKNANLQQTRKALTMGRANEYALMAAINEYRIDYGKPINIEFVSRRTKKKFLCKSIMKTEPVGAKNIFKRHKADVWLIDSSMKVYPLSVKDVTASYWESADTYWGLKSKQFLMWALDQKFTKVTKNSDGGYSISPAIAIAASPDEVHDVVFGVDIFGHGAVVVEKFNAASFTWDYARDTLVVTCKDLIVTDTDVSDAQTPYFIIRNAKDRNPKYIHQGLRTLASMKERVLLGETKVFDRTIRAKVGL